MNLPGIGDAQNRSWDPSLMVAVKFPIACRVPERFWWLRYLIATGFVLVALTLNFLPPAQNLPFLFFFGAVALTARVCGVEPALYSTALSAIAATISFYILAPVGDSP